MRILNDNVASFTFMDTLIPNITDDVVMTHILPRLVNLDMRYHAIAHRTMYEYALVNKAWYHALPKVVHYGYTYSMVNASFVAQCSKLRRLKVEQVTMNYASFSELESLRLEHVQTFDMASLIGLTRLTSLHLSHVHTIENAHLLTTLTQLRSLYADWVHDISRDSTEKMPYLTRCILGHVGI